MAAGVPGRVAGRDDWPLGMGLHSGRLTWNLKTTGLVFGTWSSKGPFPGSMLVFGSVFDMFDPEIVFRSGE